MVTLIMEPFLPLRFFGGQVLMDPFRWSAMSPILELTGGFELWVILVWRLSPFHRAGAAAASSSEGLCRPSGAAVRILSAGVCSTIQSPKPACWDFLRHPVGCGFVWSCLIFMLYNIAYILYTRSVADKTAIRFLF